MNTSTTGTPTTRLNIDTTTSPGDIKIGATKDFITTAAITCVTSNRIYTTGVGRASIAVVDMATKSLKATISLPGKPAGIVYNSVNNKVYVGDYDDNKVTIIDNSTDPPVVVGTLTSGTAGHGAYAAAYNPTDNKVYIANTGDQTVSIFDGTTGALLAGSVPVVAGGTTATFDVAADKVYFTSKANQYVTIIDGVLNQVVQDVQVDEVLNLLGGQAPGNVGLRVDASTKAINAANALHLCWDYDSLGPNQNIRFQVRTAVDIPSIDGAVYQGPDGTVGTWYDASTDGAVTTAGTGGAETTCVVLNTPYAPAAEIQVKFSSDGLGTPVLHSVSLGYEAFPDLVASAATASPAAFTNGSTISVSSTVQNIGPGAADASNVGFFLVGNGTSTFIASAMVPALGPGQSYAAGATIAVPNMPLGSYTIQACADYANTIAEAYETNNCTLGNTINIALPDLVIANVSGPSTGTIGSGISITSAVTNQGGVAAGTFKVELYLTKNGVDTFLGDRTVASLAAGATDTASTTVMIPTIPTGDYTLKACADHANMVPETNENNNCMMGGVISVYSVTPDLVVTTVNSSSNAVTGQQITVPVTVKDQGGATGSGFYVNLYLCPTSTINKSSAGCSFLAGGLISALAAGAQKTQNFITTIPVVNSGTYYIGAIADADGYIAEYDETNNTLAGTPTTISYGPDLVVTSVTSPSSAVTSQQIAVPVTVKNQGTGSTISSFYVNLYICPTSTISKNSAGCSFLSRQLASALAAGAQQSLNFTATIPVVSSGTYYIGAIADADYDNVAESDETNNTLAGTPTTISYGPDLVVTAVTSPSSAVTGQPITVPVTVKNQGITSTTSGFYVNLYFCPTSTISKNSAGCSYLAGQFVSALAAGAQQSLNFSTTIPVVSSGTYYIGAIADADNNYVTESDETNNTLAGAPTTIY